ncbi:hypothetical protein GGR51DRAFT_234575 [Nemania sp. FL0031]|nr:hypothetical protein GGR51DRAFT_234575 [Nemania sp. FL0031]
MDSVIAIPELLEAILLHLDMTSLLVSASRVNKTWNYLIETSPAIQQALYFQPVLDDYTPRNSQKHTNQESIQESIAITTDERAGVQPTVNPLLVKKFGEYFFDLSEEQRRVQYCCDAFHKLPWEENRGLDVPSIRQGNPKQDLITRVRMKRAITSQRRDCSRFTRRGASWRRMLVSQPPPKQLGALWQEAGLPPTLRPFQTAWKALIEPDTSMHTTGIRMGHLYDLIQYYAGHHDRNSLWYRVVWNHERPPFYSGFLEDECKDLLRRTPLVIELYDVEDLCRGSETREPPDLESFDSTFRCQESSQPNVPWTQIKSRGFYHPGWIFHWD